MASIYKKAAWSFKHKVNFSLLKSESLHTKSLNDRIQRNEMGIIATEVKEASSAKRSSYIAGHFLMPTPHTPRKVLHHYATLPATSIHCFKLQVWLAENDCMFCKPSKWCLCLRTQRGAEADPPITSSLVRPESYRKPKRRSTQRRK